MSLDSNGDVPMNCVHGVPVLWPPVSGRVICRECAELVRFHDEHKNYWEDELREAFDRIRQLEAAGSALAEALGDVNQATYRHELEAWAKALAPEAGRRG